MNNAERIVAAIDRHLRGKNEIVVFGSAALMLDRRYADHFAARVTYDVDIIIPRDRELQIESDQNFWQAIASANKELEPEGLYVTHIFPEREVTLTPEWKDHAVQLETPAFNHLHITRPRVLDLVVSKMGRADAQDLEDVRMMLQLDHRVWGRTIGVAELEAAAARAHVPSVYHEIFPRARARVIAAVKEIERALNSSGT